MSQYDYQALDDLIHSRIRLSIIALLVTCSEASFTSIKKKVKATDGNLSVQISKLEKAGYLTVKKIFKNRKPLSTYAITERGRTAFQEYVRQMEVLFKQ